MAEEKPGAMDILMQAYGESNGEYVDVVVEHGELAGITIDHLKWWGENLNNPEYYKMWHPGDHITHDIIRDETDKDGNTISVMYAEERVSPYGASKLRLRVDPPDSAPVKQVYPPLATNTMLGPDDEVLGGIYHEFKPTPTGMIMRSTFRTPAKTPQEFLDAMYRHSKTEMGNFPKFLPQLYAKVTGRK